VREHDAKNVIKSKSMISEEIHLNQALETDGSTVIETDLGEYIIQIAGEHPSHIIVPAMHKTRQQVADLFEPIARHALAPDTPTLHVSSAFKCVNAFSKGISESPVATLPWPIREASSWLLMKEMGGWLVLCHAFKSRSWAWNASFPLFENST
jgi:hypothetical protein